MLERIELGLCVCNWFETPGRSGNNREKPKCGSDLGDSRDDAAI
jgi:hypothetical protein